MHTNASLIKETYFCHTPSLSAYDKLQPNVGFDQGGGGHFTSHMSGVDIGSFHVKSTQNKYDPSGISSNLVWRRCLWINSATPNFK